MRVPEPRPAAPTSGKNLLLSRHTPDQLQRREFEQRQTSDRDPVDPLVYEDGPDPAEIWPPEPPPIDFHDLDLIRDELSAELPEEFDEPAPVYAAEEGNYISGDVRFGMEAKDGERRAGKTQGSRIAAREINARTDERQATPRGSGQAQNPVVPPQSVAGRALILVVAIMCFLACLAVGALVLVEEAARDWQLDVSREVTVQVKPVDGKPIEPMLQAAMDLARATVGVRNVQLMSQRDSEGLLEPWLGTGFDYTKLPVPRLILIELADPAGADLKDLATQLKVSVPSAELDDHSIWSKRLRTMAGTMVAAGVVVLLLVLTAMVLSVVFATRAAMAGNRDVVQVLHFVGAEDSFIAGEFQHHFLILGFKGGVGGGLSAMLAFLVANWITEETQGMAGSDQAHALFGGFAVGLYGYLGAAGIVLLVAGLTALTSRLTVRSYLNQLD
jgi:cell division transport system permease protein